MTEGRPILLVEDDQVDVMTVRRAFNELNINIPLEVAANGIEALGRLRESERLTPRLILLDLSTPLMGGLEFLSQLRADEHYRHLPVVVLTTSKLEQDIAAAFDLGAAGYMTKPVDYGEFVAVLRTIESYWALSELPPESAKTESN